RAIVILENFASKLEEILEDTDIELVITTKLGDLLGGVKGLLTNFVVKYVKKMVPSFHIEDAISFKEALEIGSDCRFLPPEIKSEDVGFLQYTGGTTGVSKGATLTHANLMSNLLVMEAWNGGKLSEEKEIIVTALPLYHIFAFTVNCMAMVSIGGTNLLITNPRDMKGFLNEIAKYPFTVITGVNTLFNGMLNHPDIEKVDFSHLKIAAGGGMAVQVAVNEAWKKRTGVPILEGYGLSETSPVLTTNPNDGTDQIGTIGVPVPNTDVKIMDEAGNEVAQGERGEICAKGPQVMKGYWNRLDENDKYFFPGAWFRTGDIGIMREDGFFKIVDRKKDMILVSGFNVFPNEIEDVVAHHPGVLEVAAVGVPDEKSTEAVKVFVVKKDPNLSMEDVRAYCKENLTGYKVPKHVEFREELPKSNVGKIIRRLLKEE
ncbi:MAG: AMP-binding protein, partial [Bacteroidota bacterium]